jgi:Na+/proline symporter
VPIDIPAFLAFVGYLAVVIGIGVYAARFSSAGISEFFIAGRRMHRFVVALSAVVSGRSAWLLLGLTGMAYVMGVAAIWAAVGYIVVELLLFLYYAPRLRRFSERYDCITLPDFFAARFDDRDGRLRMLLAAIIIVFMVGYVAAQFVGGGKAIGASFGLDPATGIVLTALIVLAYTILGGFLAVSLTDTLQGVLMLGALVVLPALGIIGLGGPGPVIEELRAFDPSLLDPLALATGGEPACPRCDGVLEAQPTTRLVTILPRGASGFDLDCRTCRRFYARIRHSPASLRSLRLRRFAAAVLRA